MTQRPERYRVNFTVFLSWQDSKGLIRSVSGRCLDLSPAGLLIETRDVLSPGQTVLIQSEQFGRMGHASVRHCRREPMKYFVGLQFSAPFGVGDPVRRKILEGVLIKASENKVA